MINMLSVDSLAFVHTGGTKYYRMAAVTFERNGKQVHAFYTNYGPFKGDLAMHKPMHGGQSAVVYCGSAVAARSKLASERSRRLRRDYAESSAHEYNSTQSDLTDAEIMAVLRGHVGLTTGHFNELIQETEEAAPTAPAEDTLKRDFAAMIAKTKSEFAGKHEKTAAMKGIERPPGMKAAVKSTLPPTPAPEIARTAEWGSW